MKLYCIRCREHVTKTMSAHYIRAHPELATKYKLKER